MVSRPIGPGAEQHGALAGDVAGAGDRMQADRERLGERRRLIGTWSGILTHCAGMASKKDGEAALHVRGLRGRAHEEDVLAEVGPVLAAAAQWPHQRDGLTATRSPTVTPAPSPAISTTSPAISWPSTSGEVTTKSPVRAWRIIMHVGAADAAGAEAQAHHAVARADRAAASTMRRSSGPNSVAAKAIDVILRVPCISAARASVRGCR